MSLTPAELNAVQQLADGWLNRLAQVGIGVLSITCPKQMISDPFEQPTFSLTGGRPPKLSKGRWQYRRVEIDQEILQPARTVARISDDFHSSASCPVTDKAFATLVLRHRRVFEAEVDRLIECHNRDEDTELAEGLRQLYAER